MVTLLQASLSLTQGELWRAGGIRRLISLLSYCIRQSWAVDSPTCGEWGHNWARQLRSVQRSSPRKGQLGARMAEIHSSCGIRVLGGALAGRVHPSTIWELLATEWEEQVWPALCWAVSTPVTGHLLYSPTRWAWP